MNRKGSSRKRVKCMVRKSIGEYLREKRAIFKKRGMEKSILEKGRDNTCEKKELKES